ncbi:MAG: hypothetical protein JSS09_02060, partial [Verrucomicrobia bacterium]|nr:hypothetical protein [Verrucomicrobiota bacterium]
DIAKQALEEKQREQNRRILDVSNELQIARNTGNYSNIERLEKDLSWLKSDRFFDDFFRTYPNWNELDRNLSKAKEAYNQTTGQINKREEDHIASLNQRYSLEKAALETEFQKMKRH